jgi:ubiquinone/menaquinone biosynthesis C-methylase UbiE
MVNKPMEAAMKTKDRPVQVAGAEYQPFPNEEGRNSRQSQLEIPAMVRALGIPSGARILEVGCGRGVALPVLERLCDPRRLVGLDIDPELLAEAAESLREHGTTAELCAADVRRMPFEDGAFDVIIDFGTLFHIAKPQAASAEIARVLAPGGMFVHETKASQLLSHPVRSRGRRLPRLEHDGLRNRRWAMLWAAHSKGVRR